MTFALSGAIIASKCRFVRRDRIVQIVLVKKEESIFWTQLPKDKNKWKPFVTIDWANWIDPDDDAHVGGRFDEMRAMMEENDPQELDFKSILTESAVARRSETNSAAMP